MLKQIDHREWLSGRRRGPLAALLRTSLWLASHPYDWAMRWRNRQFDTGRRAIHRAAVPVISVGNLTTGGTGKTPLVASIASHLQNTQHKVGLISRGYGSIDGAPNDEAMELAIRLPNVPHIQKRDRFAAAQQIVKHHAVTVIVMDDGMQHRRLHRDFEIIVIDATDPFGEGYVLPRGYLRENVTSLRRADAIVLTRCDAVSPASLQRTEAEITALHPSASVYRTTHQPSRWHCETCRTGELGELAGHKAAAVCGIGNPAAFAKTIAALDV
ncbi:MAG: tetraacyldisaccharide 4'-kinase, partial [Planctomycetota bacterium]